MALNLLYTYMKLDFTSFHLKIMADVLSLQDVVL